MAMLEVRDLEVYYGVIQALKGISFDVDQGEIVALIGANGAGKTTTLHTVTGLLSAKAGKIVYEGTDITRVPGYKLVSMGIAHVPEGRRVFATLTVLQNLKMGAYTRKDKNEMEETLKMIYKRFPRLEAVSYTHLVICAASFRPDIFMENFTALIYAVTEAATPAVPMPCV